MPLSGASSGDDLDNEESFDPRNILALLENANGTRFRSLFVFLPNCCRCFNHAHPIKLFKVFDFHIFFYERLGRPVASNLANGKMMGFRIHRAKDVKDFIILSVKPKSVNLHLTGTIDDSHFAVDNPLCQSSYLATMLSPKLLVVNRGWPSDHIVNLSITPG
jgi:hypothetical protein